MFEETMEKAIRGSRSMIPERSEADIAVRKAEQLAGTDRTHAIVRTNRSERELR